jgi:hypothetical protein
VQVTDSEAPPRAAAAVGLTLVVGVAPLVITSGSSLPQATVGFTPYTWSLVSGSLPPGLFVDPGGFIFGTPLAEADTTFTVQVTDSSNPAEVATASLSLTIGP